MGKKTGDVWVSPRGKNWVTHQNGKTISNHRTQGAAIDAGLLKRVVIVSILWFSARMVESDRRIVLGTIRIRRAIESTKNLVNG